MTNIAIIESQSLLQESYKLILETQSFYNVIVQGVNYTELQKADQHLDVILLDIPNFIHYCEDTERSFQSPETQMIVLAQRGEERRVIDVMNEGVYGFLFEEMEANELLQAVRQVLNHKFYIHGQATHHLLTHSHQLLEEKKQNLHQEPPSCPLTKRPFQVLQYIAEGLSNQEIAAKVHISDKTVKNHVYDILDTLDVRNRTEAVIKAIQSGWITIPKV